MIMTTSFRILATTFMLMTLASTARAQTGANQGTGQNPTGGSSTGGSSTGGSSTGQGGVTGSGLSGTSSFAGVVPGESTAASNATDTFIGSTATTGFIGGTSQAGNQQATNRQFQAIQNNQSQQSTTQQSGTAREIRTTLRVGFTFLTASQAQVSGRLANANIASLSRFSPIRPELAGIEVALNLNGTAVLTGSALNVETRRLAANLMRLQPGIRKVDNQIVVRAN